MPLAVLASSNFTDPEHERLIWLAAGGLVLLGILLIVATVIWWRGTKGEHAALAPLEVMGDRSFPELTHVEQTRRLDAVRLHLEGDVEPLPAEPGEEEVDLDEALRTFQPGFDDLRDEEVPAVDDPAKESRIAVSLAAAVEEESSAEGPVESAEPEGSVEPAASVEPEKAVEPEEKSVEPVAAEVDDGTDTAAPESPSIESQPDAEAAVADGHDADLDPDGVVATEADGEDEPVRTGEPVDR